MSVLAYKYGLLDPINWDQDAHECLFQQNRLWNALVEIERNHREKYRAIIGADDALKPIQDRIEALKAQREELRAQRKRIRQQLRSKNCTSDIDELLRECNRTMQPLLSQAKLARVEAKERTREPVAALNDERFEAAKRARQLAAEGGLYWGNYNAVFASYEAARTKAMKDGTELKFRRFTGEGRFTVQLIGGTDAQQIMTDAKQVNISPALLPVPGRSGKPRPRLNVTIYTRDDGERRYLTFPLIYDRPLPRCARIQQVTVTRRKLGTKWRYEAVFTLRMPDVAIPTRADSLRCGINLGFRQRPDGSLRIGMVYDGDRFGELSLPPEWLTAMDGVDAIRSERDRSLDAVRADLKRAWPERPAGAPADLEERLWNLLRVPKCAAASLAFQVLKWRQSQWWPQMLPRCEAWRATDKRLYEREANGRDHLMLARRERYRLIARELCGKYAIVRIGKMDLRGMAQLETSAGEETDLHARARANRQRASLYELQQTIALMAPKFGTRTEPVEGAFTATCHACGGRCATDEDLIHVCEHCSAIWDQDENAARNIFAAARERSGDD